MPTNRLEALYYRTGQAPADYVVYPDDHPECPKGMFAKHGQSGDWLPRNRGKVQWGQFPANDPRRPDWRLLAVLADKPLEVPNEEEQANLALHQALFDAYARSPYELAAACAPGLVSRFIVEIGNADEARQIIADRLILNTDGRIPVAKDPNRGPAQMILQYWDPSKGGFKEYIAAGILNIRHAVQREAEKQPKASVSLDRYLEEFNFELDENRQFVSKGASTADIGPVNPHRAQEAIDRKPKKVRELEEEPLLKAAWRQRITPDQALDAGRADIEFFEEALQEKPDLAEDPDARIEQLRELGARTFTEARPHLKLEPDEIDWLEEDVRSWDPRTSLFPAQFEEVASTIVGYHRGVRDGMRAAGRALMGLDAGNQQMLGDLAQQAAEAQAETKAQAEANLKSAAAWSEPATEHSLIDPTQRADYLHACSQLGLEPNPDLTPAELMVETKRLVTAWVHAVLVARQESGDVMGWAQTVKTALQTWNPEEGFFQEEVRGAVREENEHRTRPPMELPTLARRPVSENQMSLF